MADIVKCDFCKRTGLRRRGTLAPTDWFYLEAQDETDPNNCIVMWACSKGCANKQWLPGPGKLDLLGG